MSNRVMNSNNMSTITIQEYRERQRELEREREHDQEDVSNDAYARKKIRSSVHLPSPPLPTTISSAENMLNHTSPVPRVAASTLPAAAPTSSSFPAANTVTTTGPCSPIFNKTASKQKLAHPQQALAQTQPQTHQQQQQQMPSSPPSTALYTIADFITRYAWKLQYLDHSIKTKLLRIEAIQNDPSQDQKRRDLYLSLGNSEVRLREVEDKIEDLFRLKIANGK